MKMICRSFLFLIALVYFGFLHAQDAGIKVSAIESYKRILSELKVLESAKPVGDISPSEFTKPAISDSLTRSNFFERRYFLLKLDYDVADSGTLLYFLPGKMVTVNIYHYDSTTKSWNSIKKRESFNASSISSKILLTPLGLHSNTQFFLIEPDLHFYNWQLWNPIIAHKEAVNDLILQTFVQPSYTYSILTILMLGMMFMLFSYAFLKFYLNRRSEYLFNSLFAFTFMLFFVVLFLNNFYYQSWWHRYSGFFSYWLQALGYIWLFVFLIRFLELRINNYLVFLILRFSIIALMAYCCVLPFIAFSDRFYSLHSSVFNIVSGYLILVGLLSGLVLYQWNDYLPRYVATGNFVLIAFVTLIILLTTFFTEKLFLVQKIGGLSVLYHAGILSCLFFQRLALGHKERVEELHKIEAIEKLKVENEKKEMEKVLAIASSRVDERNKIAKEIHDDIGSGLTSIRLLSEIALVKPQNKEELKKISANANELVNNLNEIIWSINSKNDTLPNLLAYIRSHVADYIEPHNIKLNIDIPEFIPNIDISGEKRRNIFMVVKESFTNIIKHSNATLVNFNVQLTRSEVSISIKDNGKGFKKENILSFKNGVRNMQERVESIGGQIDISGDNGTAIILRLPINNGNL